MSSVCLCPQCWKAWGGVTQEKEWCVCASGAPLDEIPAPPFPQPSVSGFDLAFTAVGVIYVRAV